MSTAWSSKQSLALQRASPPTIASGSVTACPIVAISNSSSNSTDDACNARSIVDVKQQLLRTTSKQSGKRAAALSSAKPRDVKQRVVSKATAARSLQPVTALPAAAPLTSTDSVSTQQQSAPAAVAAQGFQTQSDPLIVDDYIRKHWYNLQPRYYDCDDSYLQTAPYPAVIKRVKVLLRANHLDYTNLSYEQLSQAIINDATMLQLTNNATIAPAKLSDSRLKTRLNVFKLYLYAEMSLRLG